MNNPFNMINFSERFGELEISIGTNHKKENNPYLKPQISRISNVNIATNKLIPADDPKVVFDRGNNWWHTDSSFKKIPATFSILSAREIPKEGGGTEFVDARHALETWDRRPRKYSVEQIKNLITEHSIVYSRMQNTWWGFIISIPLNSARFIRKAKHMISPFNFITNSPTALAVPPVANKSSTISTRSPSLIESLCISITVSYTHLTLPTSDLV